MQTNPIPPVGPARLDEGLHQRVARTARCRPGSTALVAEDRHISYRELDATANAWAARLAAEGVTAGHQVPIVLPRGTDLVLALLAVLKTGSAYALLDPAWPAARLREVTAVLHAPLLIAAEPVAGPDLPVWTPPVDEAAAPSGFRPAEVSGDTACCVFFTSGTTGRPKGVLTPHRATARLFAVDTFATFDENTVIPLAAPAPWDAFSLELWAALANGGTSVIVTEPYLTADGLRDGIRRHGVSTTWLTSSLFNMLVDEDPDAFAGLRLLMIGGERLSPTHVGRFLRRHPGIVLLNGYGPVECTVFATTHPISPADAEHPDGVPLGRPVPETGVHLLDGSRPCADGEIGEICLTGTGLALGYVGDEEQTARKFVTIRVGDQEVRAYRTGDLGVRDASGLLHFRGRADRQVKIRGHRIEPAEIERRIIALLPVRSCRVVVDRTGGAEPRLIAWCVPEQPDDPLGEALPVLREALPAYLLPAEIRTIAAFPVTPQGKLDERALLSRAVAVGRHAAGNGHVDRPAGMAVVVAEVFAEVLGRTGVPLDVSLSDLGGSSLDMGRVCARLADRLERPVPLAQFLDHPTVTGLAGWLQGADPGARADTGAPADTGDAEVGVVPLTPMQLIFLTRHLLDPTDLTSHCLLTWVIDGELDHEALKSAIAATHARHEPLRAAYLGDPRPMARITEVDPPPLERLPAQPSVPAAIAALRALFTSELLIEDADVWRVAVSPAGDATVLGIVVHHIAFDGWSESVLARDLAAAYNAARRGAPPPDQPAPPTLARAYGDYIERLAMSGLVDQRERLRIELARVPSLHWPVLPGPDQVAGTGLVEVSIEPDMVAAVDAEAKAAGVSRFAALLHHYAVSLAEVTGQRDFAVGIPVAQRHGARSELAVGCHIAMLCLRLRGAALGEGPGALRAAQRDFAAAFSAQDVTFQDMLRLLDLPGGSRPPLFQNLFAVQDNAPGELALEGARTTFVRQPYLDLPLELHAEIWPGEDGGLRLTLYFRRDVIAESTVEEMSKRIGERIRTL